GRPALEAGEQSRHRHEGDPPASGTRRRPVGVEEARRLELGVNRAEPRRADLDVPLVRQAQQMDVAAEDVDGDAALEVLEPESREAAAARVAADRVAARLRSRKREGRLNRAPRVELRQDVRGALSDEGDEDAAVG